MLLKSLHYPDLSSLTKKNFTKNTDDNTNSYTGSHNVYHRNKDSHSYAKPYKSGLFSSLINVYEKRRTYFIFSLFTLLLIVFYILFNNIFLSFFMSIMCTGIINEFFSSVLRRRKEILETQLIEFVVNMIIMLKAGREIRQIFKESIFHIKDPLRSCLKHLVNEVELNISMDNALDNFAVNIGSREAGLLVNAIKINRKIGGNLLIVLENIIRNLQQNLKIKSWIKTQTAQNRFSSNVIALFPMAGFVGMYFFLNSIIKDFLSSTIGNILLMIGALFEFSGFLIIKKTSRENFI